MTPFRKKATLFPESTSDTSASRTGSVMRSERSENHPGQSGPRTIPGSS
jgi:hypothetical protein